MKRYIFAGTALCLAILAVMFAFNGSAADENEWRGFHGSVTYTNCDCTDQAYADFVYVQELPSGTPKSYPVSCFSGVGYYDTEDYEDVFEPGDYKLWVQFNAQGPSECETSQIRQVEHQYGYQEVNLNAYGPTGGGTR